MNIKSLRLTGDFRRLRLALLDLFAGKELPQELESDLDRALTDWMLSEDAEARELVRRSPSLEAAALLEALNIIERLSSEGDYDRIWRSPSRARAYLSGNNLAIRGLQARGVFDQELAAEYRRSFVGRVIAIGYGDALERAMGSSKVVVRGADT